MIRVAEEVEGGTLLPDLTPLLDVIFIMLVFLLLSANSVPRALQLELPEDAHSMAKQQTPPKTMTVSLSEENNALRWALDAKPVASWAALTAAISAAKARDPERMLIIEAQQTTDLNDFLKLMTWLQQQGYPAAHILMQDAE